MSFSIGQGDQVPDMVITCRENGVAKNLTGATCELRWRKPDGSVVMVALTAVDLAAGQVKRVWAAGDTDIPGTHQGQVIATTNGVPQTFPADSDAPYVEWTVIERLR